MMKWLVMIPLMYMLIGLVVFVLHVSFLQMVTPGLALARATVWPYYLFTGRPHGVPLPMD